MPLCFCSSAFRVGGLKKKKKLDNFLRSEITGVSPESMVFPLCEMTEHSDAFVSFLLSCVL